MLKAGDAGISLCPKSGMVGLTNLSSLSNWAMDSAMIGLWRING